MPAPAATTATATERDPSPLHRLCPQQNTARTASPGYTLHDPHRSVVLATALTLTRTRTQGMMGP
ncbi:hypothetical protein SynWH8101_1220 [Synechococcus sp. WH 8101]|nr:hypothetical protein SynWH8101_1220 [Synechococcus sp. WH 8101]QNI45030.1 hypothetical protein SynRCC2555_01247 [Synechococcus sp. WH 8101]